MFDMGFISKYAHMYVSAAGLTLRIAFFGIIFSLILGAFCSMVQYFKIPVIRRIVGVYIELSRNTPLARSALLHLLRSAEDRDQPFR